jgi:predicted metal-dependent hydrolase
MVQQDDGRGPLIVAFVDDLMTATRIEGVGSHLGYHVSIVGKAEMLAPGAESSLPDRPGEPVHGSLAVMIDSLTAWGPALLIFDMANQAIPWRNWLTVLKSSPATRRLPVICFGPHVDKAAIAEAAGLLAESDAVVPRSKFFATMPDMLANMILVHDHAALVEACHQPLSESARQGLEAFNRAEYFLAHEHLEDAWNEEQAADRELYRAVLQIAVAYLQIERRNYPGAAKMFLRARQWLQPLPDTCRGIDVARLRIDAENARKSLIQLGPDGLDRFDLGSLQPVHYVAGGTESDRATSNPDLS